MGRKDQEIQVVFHPPGPDAAIRRFEKAICAYDSAQTEKRLHASGLSKQEKLEALKALTASDVTFVLG